MPIEIGEETLGHVKRMFGAIENDVKIYFFRKEGECMYCDDTEQILDTLAGLSDKIHILKLGERSKEARKYGIPMFPAILIHGKHPYNIRYFGIPAGYEFGAFVEDLIDVSRGDVDIEPELKNIIRKRVRRPLRIMVFVTPTCPYCPLAVRTSHKLAIVNDLITGDTIEALEFQELASRYFVYAVPKVVIQVGSEDKVEFEGPLPTQHFVEKILEALGEDAL
ncbi:MAG: glutaredoxin [Thermoprotei archaeon]|nr:MAG: glutaredoxin [Thermoprotei archaeon]